MSNIINPPQDLISSVRFSQDQWRSILVSSWDGTIRIYSPQDRDSLKQSVHLSAPLLDSCWDANQGNVVAYAGGLSGQVQCIEVESGNAFTIGRDHEKAVKSIVMHKESGSIISGSWDKTLQQIDPRSQANSSRFLPVPGKVFSMDSIDNYLVVGMSDRLVNIYDMRNLERPLQQRESSLKYPTRTVRCMADRSGFVTTSIEGRVAVELFDPSSNVQAQKYAFKCHRSKVNNADTANPVNAIAFHPKYSTFFTGGSDCTVCLWDHKAKKRLRQYQRLPWSVMSLDVDPAGSLLAIGVSDDSFKGNPVDLGSQPIQSAIYVRSLEGDGRRN